jgi:hypothetical protein
MNIGSDYTEPLVGEWKECKAIKRRHDATWNRVVMISHAYLSLAPDYCRLFRYQQQTQMASSGPDSESEHSAVHINRLDQELDLLGPSHQLFNPLGEYSTAIMAFLFHISSLTRMPRWWLLSL